MVQTFGITVKSAITGGDYLTKYPNATEIGSSGIGNTPYVICANNTDNYHLMKPVIVPSPNPEQTPTPSQSPSPSTESQIVPELYPIALFAIACAVSAFSIGRSCLEFQKGSKIRKEKGAS
jgi:hypothetical protein